MAATTGSGMRARAIDVTDWTTIAEALAGVSVVISCIDQPGRLLLKASLARGLGYTDITPHLTELGRGSAYRQIDAGARASGARLILGSGIVPGISNVMVRALADFLGGADEIETALLLGAGDISGPASLEYFLQELVMTFDVHIHGRDHPARALSEPRMTEFPHPIGSRNAYLFPFSDQVLYPCTMGVRTAVTRLALEPDWLARLLALASRSHLAKFLAGKAVRHTIARALRIRTAIEGARFALRVDVTRRGCRGMRFLPERPRRRQPRSVRRSAQSYWSMTTGESRAHGCPSRSRTRRDSSSVSPRAACRYRCRRIDLA